MNSKNIPASVKAQLLNIARSKNEIFTNLLIRYAMERFLYRLSISEYAEQYILKGAALYNYWHGEPHRPTLDADFSLENIISLEEAEKMVKQLCGINFEDGMLYLEDTISAEDIREDNEYQGIRVRFRAKLDSAVIPVQIDIGFCDSVIPPPVAIEYPTLLEFPAPRMLAYSVENCIAEKIQIMLEKGMVNSRMKDYYDVWFMNRTFEIDAAKLQRAVEETFKRRKTVFPEAVPIGLSREFIEDRQKKSQWKGFQKKIGIKEADLSLESVVASVRDFIMPVIETAAKKK